ncbi:YceI family protein [Actinobacteria bacterium YIM 96077]|uniref:YceI family protein n=1 Tax=Phytoactinopolyspora halophila TaxID=1981511 RepID=A0A329QPS2_9ACTN|nr:YceI family protein [Phytoactinopolyspora halophila]AYY15071.1 YceI family protein [Actinobacteria bacterium YIM 96077]RAW14166.1 YceI family protein [Phytoactinopolyspora halophila]
MPWPSNVSRRLLVIAGSIAAIAILAVLGTWIYINVISDEAAEPFGLEAGSGEALGDDAVLDGTWTVDTGSEAGYRVDEVLNGMDNTVVGRTSDVTGEITVSDDTATAAEIVVEMASVTTDSDSRDGQFRDSIMNTDEYPTSRFTLLETVPLGELRNSPEPTEHTVRGELTLRDVTREVEVELALQAQGDSVRAAGSIPITFTDFDIEPPDLAFVRVEDEGFVEFSLSLTRE